MVVCLCLTHCTACNIPSLSNLFEKSSLDSTNEKLKCPGHGGADMINCMNEYVA